jgi:hypothetical protein
MPYCTTAVQAPLALVFGVRFNVYLIYLYSDLIIKAGVPTLIKPWFGYASILHVGTSNY